MVQWKHGQIQPFNILSLSRAVTARISEQHLVRLVDRLRKIGRPGRVKDNDIVVRLAEKVPWRTYCGVSWDSFALPYFTQVILKRPCNLYLGAAPAILAARCLESCFDGADVSKRRDDSLRLESREQMLDGSGIEAGRKQNCRHAERQEREQVDHEAYIAIQE